MYVHPTSKCILANCENKSAIIRLGVLLLLFDVYLTWARIEKQTSASPVAIGTDNTNLLRLAQQPIVFQYVFFCETNSRNVCMQG